MVLHTTGEFLEPWHGPGADELHHALARTARTSGADRYGGVSEVELWKAFYSSRISSSRQMRAFLDKRFNR